MIQALNVFAAEFDRRFAQRLTPTEAVPSRLGEAVRYSALAPGKRLRPYLVVQCCEIVGGNPDDAWPAAFAIECVHAFSLVHDDLPAMDNDDLRRGRPTCHRQFNEATAILTGDALVVLAFESLASGNVTGPIVADLTRELAQAAGWQGMIGGQASDVAGEHGPPDVALVRSIHERKTAALFVASCRMGAMAGGANENDRARLGAFGRALGLGFQIADDLLDLSGTSDAAGKRVGKDAAHGKQTWPASVGVEESRRALKEFVDEAIAVLEPFGARADALRDVARSVGSRHY